MDDFMDDMDFDPGYDDGDLDDYGDGYDQGFQDDVFDEGIEETDIRHPEAEDCKPDNWISPLEASIMGYGFGYEEGLSETRRRKRIKQKEQDRRKREDQ